MPTEKDLYTFEASRKLEQVADYLEDIARDVRKGHLTFDDGTELDLPETVILDVDVDQYDKPNKVKTSVELEIEWTTEK